MADATTQTRNGKTALTDDIRTHFSGDAPLTQKATNFAKARPWASAALSARRDAVAHAAWARA